MRRRDFLARMGGGLAAAILTPSVILEALTPKSKPTSGFSFARAIAEPGYVQAFSVGWQPMEKAADGGILVPEEIAADIVELLEEERVRSARVEVITYGASEHLRKLRNLGT